MNAWRSLDLEQSIKPTMQQRVSKEWSSVELSMPNTHCLSEPFECSTLFHPWAGQWLRNRSQIRLKCFLFHSEWSKFLMPPKVWISKEDCTFFWSLKSCSRFFGTKALANCERERRVLDFLVLSVDVNSDWGVQKFLHKKIEENGKPRHIHIFINDAQCHTMQYKWTVKAEQHATDECMCSLKE